MNTTQSETQKNRAAGYLKWKYRADFAVALVTLLLAGLPMLLIGILVRLDSKGPAIFAQPRVGKDEKLFSCYKFRTMRSDTPHQLSTAAFTDSGKYITRMGHFLRKTSIDELPQLVNILRGEMSFIGPRPLIPEEEAVHAMRRERGVYALRPGISGYAQVNGRDFVSDEEKAALDAYYLEHVSLKTDAGVLLKTVVNVLKKKDIQN